MRTMRFGFLRLPPLPLPSIHELRTLLLPFLVRRHLAMLLVTTLRRKWQVRRPTGESAVSLGLEPVVAVAMMATGHRPGLGCVRGAVAVNGGEKITVDILLSTLATGVK